MKHKQNQKISKPVPSRMANPSTPWSGTRRAQCPSAEYRQFGRFLKGTEKIDAMISAMGPVERCLYEMQMYERHRERPDLKEKFALWYAGAGQRVFKFLADNAEEAYRIAAANYAERGLNIEDFRGRPIEAFPQ